MSDSLKATVIVILLVLTISANGEVEPVEVEEDEELELPRLPAVVAVGLLVEEVVDDPVPEVVDVDALEVEPADTESPGERFASDTIVPLIGAYSLVAASALLALLTLASALYTTACAEATVPAGDVVPDELPVPVEPVPVEPPPADGAVADVLGAAVAGVVAVGAVVVDLVVVVVVWGVVVDGGVVVVWLVGVAAAVVVFAVVVVGTVLVADTNSVVPEPEPVSRLVVVVDVELASAVVSWSSAAVRFFFAWSSESWAEPESRVASS
jgi:hypothetical protein